MKIISHKYKSLSKFEGGRNSVEIFEYCSKYHVRLYGVGDNFVDFYIGESMQDSNFVYNHLVQLINSYGKGGY